MCPPLLLLVQAAGSALVPTSGHAGYGIWGRESIMASREVYSEDSNVLLEGSWDFPSLQVLLTHLGLIPPNWTSGEPGSKLLQLSHPQLGANPSPLCCSIQCLHQGLRTNISSPPLPPQQFGWETPLQTKNCSFSDTQAESK